MAYKRFVIEMGIGTDLHGADMTKVAERAVRDAVSRSCLCGIIEIFGRTDFTGVRVHADLAIPEPDEVNREAVLAAIPVGEKSLAVSAGGLRVPGIEVERFGPGSSDIVMACVALTVSVDC
jgi:uncharacterized protein (TIGR02058 family)